MNSVSLALLPHDLTALFQPKSVVFVGGSNLSAPLRYHREQGFAGQTWILNPKHQSLGGYPCFASVQDLPSAPDLAFVAIKREAAIAVIAELRAIGCKAVICNAAGFSEMGADGASLQAQLLEAAGDMALIGPNAIGIANFLDPMAAMMDHFGVANPSQGVAIVSQGGGFLCDMVFCDRGLDISHLVGCGNQAKTSLAACADYLLDDPRVTAVGLAFEGLADIAGLRRAAVKALRLGKPLVAIKFAKSQVGAEASRSHTASMAGKDAAWQALFERLGIVATDSESEFIETLKLLSAPQRPKGRRVLVASASGVMGIMLADHLERAGFELPQPDPDRAERLRALLPGIATPCNPQDITMAAWNDLERQTAIYRELLGQGYDLAIMGQNYPREGMWDIAEYSAQVEAMGAACRELSVAGAELAPLVDCFPPQARQHTQAQGMAALQGLSESIAALGHAVWWQQRREALLEELPAMTSAVNQRSAQASGRAYDEAEAKTMLADAGLTIPAHRVCPADDPAAVSQAAGELGFPVALKVLDARLLHKTEVGAVALGLASAEAVESALATMRTTLADKAPHIPLERVLVEAMADKPLVEVMASISIDPAVGPVMMVAGGGVQAELWNDSQLLAAPFTRAAIEAALSRLKVARLLEGWRGQPAGDRQALINALLALADCAQTQGLQELEINPLFVHASGVTLVDAVMQGSQSQPTRAGD